MAYRFLSGDGGRYDRLQIEGTIACLVNASQVLKEKSEEEMYQMKRTKRQTANSTVSNKATSNLAEPLLAVFSIIVPTPISEEQATHVLTSVPSQLFLSSCDTLIRTNIIRTSSLPSASTIQNKRLGSKCALGEAGQKGKKKPAQLLTSDVCSASCESQSCTAASFSRGSAVGESMYLQICATGLRQWSQRASMSMKRRVIWRM